MASANGRRGVDAAAALRRAAPPRQRREKMCRYWQGALLLLTLRRAESHPWWLVCSQEMRVGGPDIMEAPVGLSTITMQVRKDSAAGALVADGDDVTVGTTLYVSLNGAPSGTEWHTKSTAGTWTKTEKTCDYSGDFQESLALSTDGEVAQTMTISVGHCLGFVSVLLVPDVSLNLLSVPTEAPTPPPTPLPVSAPTPSPLAGTLAPAPPSPPPTAAPTVAEDPNLPASYQFCIIITELSRGNYEWCWSVSGSLLHNRITVDHNGYIGWAASKADKRMDEADAVIGSFGIVRRYLFDGHDVGAPLPGSQQDLTNEAITVSGGTTEITFTRTLAGTFGGRDIIPAGGANFIIAIGATDAFEEHGGDNRVGLVVDLQTGAFKVENDTNAYVVAHAWLMGLAWMLFAPIGVLASVYRDMLPGKGGLWFNVHMPANLLAVLLNFLGFVVIIARDGELEADGPHQALGVVIFVFANLTVLAAFFRPAKPEEKAPPSTKRRVWELLHKATGFVLIIFAHVNVLSGLSFDQVQEGEDYEAMPIIFLCVFLILVLGKKLKDRVWPKERGLLSGGYGAGEKRYELSVQA